MCRLAFSNVPFQKDAEIKLSEEHSEYKWVPIEQLSEVQRIRVIDALTYDGKVVSRVL